MSTTASTRPFLHPGALGASLAALVLTLAACSSSTPAESAGGAESQGAAACEVTDGATAAATITIASSTFGDEATISAGEAVTFTNDDGVGHTITEGTGGQAASDACVNESIAGGASVTVTFNEPGDYDITCTIHTSMQTVVHVQ
jgi:plastocyanin